MRVAVTGASGKLGRVVVPDLLTNGCEVVALDAQPPRDPAVSFTRIDLTDYGHTIEALTRIDSRHDHVDALVHLAAIPAPGLMANAASPVDLAGGINADPSRSGRGRGILA